MSDKQMRPSIEFIQEKKVSEPEIIIENKEPPVSVITEEKPQEEKITLNNKNNLGKIDKNTTAIEIIERLKAKRNFEEVMLPSKSLVYESIGLQPNQSVHVRAMTIAEEKVLSTPRLVRSGQALDKIFESCLMENVDSNNLLVVDRTFLLFYIRGISYGPSYEVSIKCPSCQESFEDEINLDSLQVSHADDNFDDDICAELPHSGLKIWYRLPRGSDEKNLSRHRQHMIKGLGNQMLDDTIVKRNIMLTNRIEHFKDRTEIEQIINNLSVLDSNFLRDKISDPPFGVDTSVNITCPLCYHEWEMEVPIDVNFFFPKTKKG
jgi:hypothetical protein